MTLPETELAVGKSAIDLSAERERRANTYFGGCPKCKGCDGYRNAGASHWFFCVRHRMRWCAGVNLFSDWRAETEACQRERFRLIEDFGEVRPYYATGGSA
jgi:hypothetical protein